VTVLEIAVVDRRTVILMPPFRLVLTQPSWISV